VFEEFDTNDVNCDTMWIVKIVQSVASVI